MKEYAIAARRAMEEVRRSAVLLHRDTTGEALRSAVVDRLSEVWGIDRGELIELYDSFGFDREVLIEGAAFRCTPHYKQHVQTCLPAMFRPRGVVPIGDGDLIVAAVGPQREPVALARGMFGLREFRAAMREAAELGLDTRRLYVLADLCSYSGPAIYFTKIEELPGYAYTEDEAFIPSERVVDRVSVTQAQVVRQQQLLADAAALLEQIKQGTVAPTDEIVATLLAGIDGVMPAAHRAPT